MDKEEKLYYGYLINLVKIPGSKNYHLLFERLWNKEYYSILPNDQNRAKDGLFVRQEIEQDLYEYDFGPCRVLEMLIALSRRMEFELDGSEFNKTATNLFWEMLENLDLIRFDNLNVLKDARTLEIDCILTNWLDRRYGSNGFGGIFPIKNWHIKRNNPQNGTEVWYQMMAYLEENYEI